VCCWCKNEIKIIYTITITQATEEAALLAAADAEAATRAAAGRVSPSVKEEL